MERKILAILLVMFFALANVTLTLVYATPQAITERINSSIFTRFTPRVQRPPKTDITIRNIPSGDTVYSTVTIIARLQGSASAIVYQIDTGPEYLMSRVGSTDRYQASWDTTTVTPGSHTLTVKAEDTTGKVLDTNSVTVTVSSDYVWELYYEIDYVIGHVPTQAVLDYMQSYWRGHAIKFTFFVDDAVSDPTPGDSVISDNDFWTLENQYNDYLVYDDRSYGGASPKYFLKEKWMLYGTYYTSTSVAGYTYVYLSGNNLQAGNYIFIADAMIDNWELHNGIPSKGGEAVVLMHEAGHSIGIAKVRGGSELYDSDYYSVMSYLRTQNSGFTGVWYYSREYWATRNMEYYTI